MLHSKHLCRQHSWESKLSIGIALIVPDGVILVADGRRSHPQSSNPNARVEDNTDKVVSLAEHVYAIPFGVVQATDSATMSLKASLKHDSSPELIRSETDASLKLSWNQLLRVLASDVDVNHPSMRAALIVGGISQDETFISVSLQGSGVNQPPLLIQDSFHFIVLGGEQHQARTHFTQQLKEIVINHPWSFSEGPHNMCTRKVIQGAYNTIQHITELDPTIGGAVRYAIIRKGFSVIKEIYSPDFKENL